MKFKRRRSFFRDLDTVFTGPFFDDCIEMADSIERERLRVERYLRRRAINAPKAYRILMRIRKVEAINLFKMTQDIEPDFFGRKTEQFDRVKELHEKKARILWFLRGLYHYWAFDEERFGWAVKRGFTYSRHRKHYYKLLEVLAEKVRQAKWDLKRAKTRSRREKKAAKDGTPYEVQRGVGNNLMIRPLPVPILGDEVEEDEYEWD